MRSEIVGREEGSTVGVEGGERRREGKEVRREERRRKKNEPKNPKSPEWITADALCSAAKALTIEIPPGFKGVGERSAFASV